MCCLGGRRDMKESVTDKVSNIMACFNWRCKGHEAFRIIWIEHNCNDLNKCSKWKVSERLYKSTVQKTFSYRQTDFFTVLQPRQSCVILLGTTAGCHCKKQGLYFRLGLDACTLLAGLLIDLVLHCKWVIHISVGSRSKGGCRSLIQPLQESISIAQRVSLGSFRHNHANVNE